MSETWKVGPKKTLVEEHIERCLELYGMTIDQLSTKRTVPLAEHEQMRADLMLAIGMLSALSAPPPHPTA